MGLNRYTVGAERAPSHSFPSLKPIDHDSSTRANTKAESGSYFVECGKFNYNMMGSHYESSLFSSSLFDLFS